MGVFFLLRIITFYYSGYSRGLFLSGSINDDQYAFALFYIFLSSLFLCCGLIMNWTYQSFDYFDDIFDRVFHKALLIILFIDGFIVSFGFDWSIVRIIYFYISYIFVRKLLINKSNQHLQPV